MSFSYPSNLPYEGCQGEWVLRAEFQGRKSFGSFQCNYCRKNWISAHAQKNFRQGCAECEREFLPIWMWQNDSSSQRSGERNQSDEDGPHRADLCQACRQGRCLESGYVEFGIFGDRRFNNSYRGNKPYRGGYRPNRRNRW